MAPTGLLSVLLLLLHAFIVRTNAARECQSTDCYRYYNKQTRKYFVEKWPLVNWPTGEFYAGNVPIDESDPSRSLFFVFKPASDAPVNETTIWLNGGPGCSSLAGFLQEVGPIEWAPGQLKPVKNQQYAWSKITNMLWVEYPVGVGFTTGEIRARNEVDAAKDFVGFFKNFQKLFSIQDYKTYVTVLSEQQ
ncbi:uncharacterized protein LTR77_002226 [Saxophila tyrrhenica]|uniref:Serine carboxypeptidase n=1 Tax=Saxophila tyrrhenica TaxID=1690608 RepID=A0AAV9PL09_9PEZI|nr:hypothetical protein LTR77_002226 [Saxophila tyrrhenica]